ncbi:Periplasmic Sensor Hybrid Histidine Kinase [Beggiatoa sp. PS]|nr:Periplasmic Sensor Hybrid Histidine Kinase [Beggiatoa sp. PS]
MITIFFHLILANYRLSIIHYRLPITHSKKAKTMNQSTPPKSTRKDIIFIFICSIFVFWLASAIDAFELLVDLAHQHEEWEIDEFFTVTIILAIALGIFSWRRWRECEYELTYRKSIQSQLKIAKDIAETEKKQAEIARKEAEVAQEKAEIANQAKSEFLASMSHELRTPLNGILGYAQILRRDKSLNNQQQYAIHTMQKSGEHLLTLINDILDLSKIEAQKMELHQQDFHFSHFLTEIVDMIQVRAMPKTLEFQHDFEANLPIAVNGDETRLRQILVNLLGNAVKFTERGKVTFKVILIGEKEKKIENRESSPLPNIRFQIEDTGPGIAPEFLKTIFEPFQQVGTERYITEGTGLGLPLSQKFVEMMDSSLQVTSTVGEGSIFWFELQLPEAVDWQHNDIVQGTIIGFEDAPRKILVVDDNAANRMIFFGLLFPLGFEVIEAENGQQGIETAKALLPDLIIMDLVMPIMDGLEATRQLRQIPALKNVIIIAASASAFDKQRKECLGVGCDDFVTKPIEADEVLEKLQEHLKLTWIYEAENTIEASPSTPQEIVAPPTNIAQTLHELALIGDIDGIIEQATKLTQIGNQFEPFAKQVQQLANDFEIEQLQILVKPYLKNSF